MPKQEPTNPPVYPLDIDAVLVDAHHLWAGIYRLAAEAVKDPNITDIDRIEFRRCQALAMYRCAESEHSFLGDVVEVWIKTNAYQLLMSNGDDFDIPPRYKESIDGPLEYDGFVGVHKSLFGKPWKPKEFDDEEDAFQYWKKSK